MNNIVSEKPYALNQISDKKWQTVIHKLEELVEIEFLFLQQKKQEND